MKRSAYYFNKIIGKRRKINGIIPENLSGFVILQHHWEKIIYFLKDDWLSISRLMRVNHYLNQKILQILGSEKPQIFKKKVKCLLENKYPKTSNHSQIHRAQVLSIKKNPNNQFIKIKIIYKLCPLGCLLLVRNIDTQSLFVMNVCNNEDRIMDYLKNNYQILSYSSINNKYVIGEKIMCNRHIFSLTTCRSQFLSKNPLSRINNGQSLQRYYNPEKIYHWDAQVCSPYFNSYYSIRN